MMCTGVSALAEKQTETPTHDGKKVTCTMNCTFYVKANDKATASTSWAGAKDHQIGTYLYQCKNALDSYHLEDSYTNAKTANVSASASSVWKFKSVHKIYHMSGNKITKTLNLVTITDW